MENSRAGTEAPTTMTMAGEHDIFAEPDQDTGTANSQSGCRFDLKEQVPSGQEASDAADSLIGAYAAHLLFSEYSPARPQESCFICSELEQTKSVTKLSEKTGKDYGKGMKEILRMEFHTRT